MCIIICKSRDGSTTIRELFHAYYKLNIVDSLAPELQLAEVLNKVRYVEKSTQIWEAISMGINSDDWSFLARIFISMTGDIQITHGWAFSLPLVASVFGSDRKIIFVHRDRESHIKSLLMRLEINPTHWINFLGPNQISQSDIVVRHPTATDYKEVSSELWKSMDESAKFGWWIDKQEKMMETHNGLFNQTIDINCEDLSDPSTIEKIFQFVFGDRYGLLPKPIHVHKTVGIANRTLNESQLRKVEGFFEQIDYEKLVRDDPYACDIYEKDLIERFPHLNNEIGNFFRTLK